MTAISPHTESWIAAIDVAADRLVDLLASGRCDQIVAEASCLGSLCLQTIQAVSGSAGMLPPPPCAGLDVRGFGRRLSAAMDRGDFIAVADIADELEGWGS